MGLAALNPQTWFQANKRHMFLQCLPEIKNSGFGCADEQLNIAGEQLNIAGQQLVEKYTACIAIFV
jgi:hypothetical protein